MSKRKKGKLIIFLQKSLVADEFKGELIFKMWCKSNVHAVSEDFYFAY